MTFKERVFDVLEKRRKNDPLSDFFYYFLVALIILNIVAVIAGSFNDIPTELRKLLSRFQN